MNDAIPGITFDDGPSEWTPAILDHLAAQQRHAAFFVIGKHIAGREKIVRRIVAEGHTIGVHTFTHPRLTGLTEGFVRGELAYTINAVQEATGVRPWLWRAPFFATDTRVDGVAATLRLAHFGASITPDDWMLTDPAEIADRVLHLWQPDSVVCLHDGIPPDGGSTNCGPSRQATVDALPAILEGTR